MMRAHTDHQRAVAELLAPLGARLADPAQAVVIPVFDALGRVLATDVASPTALPRFANSQMDGYAVHATDLASASASDPVRLPVGRTSAAGDPVFRLEAGHASPVMTGAAVPDGADAVIPIEQADPPSFAGIGAGSHDAPAGTTVSFAASVAPGTFVRAVGTDIAEGAVVLRAGTRLGPAQLGSLAAAGVVEVPVRPRPRVLVLSTGHELRAPGADLDTEGDSGAIYDANSTMMTAAVVDAGAIAVTDIAPDDAAAVVAVLERHPEVDLVVTTGGVSAGAFEVVRDALAPLGVDFGPVAMQPGGPQGLGLATVPGGRRIPVVAFPGNPVSTLVSFELFLRPVLRGFAGLPPQRPTQHAVLAHPVTSPPARHQVRRGTLRADGSVEVGAPSSHLLHAYALANVLVHLPVGVDALPAGAEVEVWRIDE
ncbi:gephyrin-like molybdotransferase Glp [Microbacterium candidum]|uniref:Molybdopterin molybdenumtransferase n=1 Tax=Microbacterium candidum TaxID=3041922 RepID=A0ABT7MYH5_9MICO|nr:gephyrin-like molybdotransferase Glp [Microbacterium sp. ASV49]MDL9979509.1 molybdopterin molybdotransferase MoeA [Microbacterium sp. ASV49]